MSDTEDGEVAVHHVWDPVLGVSRPLAEDEWELESHWAGLLEVHGEKMPGHDWMFVVPKYKLEAAEARVTELLAEREETRALIDRLLKWNTGRFTGRERDEMVAALSGEQG